MRLRQIALVARELEPLVSDLRTLLGLGAPYHDPGVGVFGLENAVLPVGDTFLEVVSPAEESTTAGRFLQRRGGDGGYMVIFQTSNLENARRRVEELGVAVVWEVALEGAATIHLHPRDLGGGAIVSIDAMDPPESWRWAGPHWRHEVRSDTSIEIAGVGLAADDPGAMAARWAEVLGLKLTRGACESRLDVGDSTIVFDSDTEGRGQGVSAVYIRTADSGRILKTARSLGLKTGPASVFIGGVTIHLV